MKQFTEGKPVPEVDPADIQRARQKVSEITRHDPPPAPGEGATGIYIRCFEGVCSPGANIQAVAFRSMIVGILIHLKLLDPWLHGDDLDDAVYRVAAKFPIAGIQRFKPEEFLEDLRHARS